MDEKLQLLNTTKECIDETLRYIEVLVNDFNCGNENSAILIVSKIVENLELIINALNLTQDAQKQNIDSTELNDIFNEIMDGIQNGDFILVSDLFKYEIAPVLEKWKGKIDAHSN